MLVYINQHTGTGTRQTVAVAEAVVCAQAKFFSSGHNHAMLVPLTMADVARTLNIHVSQVSRAVFGVSISDRNGAYPLKFFFDKGSTVSGSGRGRIRSEFIKNRMEVMMKLNSKITDKEIAHALAVEGILIARRTVTKYRHEIQK